MPKPATAALQPIPLTDIELSLMQPYLQRAASGLAAYRSAQESLEAIAKTISGRAGAPPEQRYKLDLPSKSLIPIS